MSDQVTTENGNNWTVVFFECSTDALGQVLVDLFQYIGKIEKAKIPHFMLREFIGKHVGISLRVLRHPNYAKIVDSEIARFMKNKSLSYKINPEGNRHAWIRKDQRRPKWNRKRCEALNQLSRFVVSLVPNSVFSASDKCHMAHYLINMFALQEATVPGSDQVYFLDLVSGRAYSFKTFRLPLE